MPTAGKRDSNAMLVFQMTLGMSRPARNALFTARNKSNSNAIIRAAATKPQRLIADPSTKIRTTASTAKKRTKEMTPTIRFSSLLSIACRKAGDASCKCPAGLVIIVRSARSSARLQNSNFRVIEPHTTGGARKRPSTSGLPWDDNGRKSLIHSEPGPKVAAGALVGRLVTTIDVRTALLFVYDPSTTSASERYR